MNTHLFLGIPSSHSSIQTCSKIMTTLALSMTPGTSIAIGAGLYKGEFEKSLKIVLPYKGQVHWDDERVINAFLEASKQECFLELDQAYHHRMGWDLGDYAVQFPVWYRFATVDLLNNKQGAGTLTISDAEPEGDYFYDGDFYYHLEV